MDLNAEISEEQWFSLPPEKQRQLLSHALAQHRTFLGGLTPEKLYRYRRHTLLSACKGWRDLYRRTNLAVLRDNLKEAQNRLAALRVERKASQDA